MKKFISFFFLAGLLFACEPEEKVLTGKKIQFVVGGLPEVGSRTTNTSEPDRIMVTILDDDGNIILEREEIPLIKFGEGFLSTPITLQEHNNVLYALSEFLVLDGASHVRYVTPKEGSEFAHLVSDPLNINFQINENSITTVEPEVLEVENSSDPIRYGYGQFGFHIIQTIDVTFSGFTPVNSNLELTDFHLTIEGLADSTGADTSAVWRYPVNMEAEAKTLKLRKANAYRITATNPDYKEWKKVKTIKTGTGVEIIFEGKDGWGFTRVWNMNYGGSMDDIPLGSLQTPDGGTIILAMSNSGSGDFPSAPAGGIRSYGTKVMKINSAGSIVWANWQPGHFRYTNEIIRSANNDGYLISGAIRYFQGSPYYDGSPSGTEIGYLIKIDQAGNLLWEKNFPSMNFISSIEYSHNTGHYILLSSLKNNAAGNLSVLTEVSEEGEVLREKKLNAREGVSGPQAFSGLSYVNDGFVMRYTTNNYTLLLKLNDQLDIAWESEPVTGLKSSNFKPAIHETTNGYIMFDTRGYGNLTVTCGNQQYPKGSADAWMVKFTPSGHIAWEKAIGDHDSEFLTTITPLPSGNYLVGAGNISACDSLNRYFISVLEITPEGEIVGEKNMKGRMNLWASGFTPAIVTSIQKTNVAREYMIVGAREEGDNNDRNPPRHGYTDVFAMRIKFNE